jgi:hypothetical protein
MSEVTATTLTGPSALDTQPDARQNQPKPEGTADGQPSGSGDPAQATTTTDQSNQSDTQQQPPSQKSGKKSKNKQTQK